MEEVLSGVLVMITVAGVLLLDRSQNPWLKRLLAWIPAILFAYLIPAFFTHLFSLDLTKVWLHDFSRSFVMPLAILAVMSALSFRQLRAIGYRPILVFVSGSMTVALAPVLLLLLFGLFTGFFQEPIIGRGYWQGLVTLVGSWIGGSASMLVLKEVAGCGEAIFLAILVMDNVLVNIWTILMFQFIKRSEQFNDWLGIQDKPIDFIPDEVDPRREGWASILRTMVITLAVVFSVSALVPGFLARILILSVVGLVLGNVLSWWNHALVIKLGGYMIILIMAILGLKLNFNQVSLPYAVMIFAVIWLVLHYVVMTIVAYGLKLNMAWVPIASMANVGGISTAPAVTKAFNEEWMPHAILLAILSMVTGTTWGLLTIWLFNLIWS